MVEESGHVVAKRVGAEVNMALVNNASYVVTSTRWPALTPSIGHFH